MKIDNDILRLSATDLSKHLACRHLTQVDRAYAERRLDAEPWHDPSVEHRMERGLEHERVYVDHLRALGKEIVDLRRTDEVAAGDDGLTCTLDAMHSGAEVIVQAKLVDGRWLGYADILERVEKPSELGNYSYEVVDTKLAQDTTAGTVLQLCLYSDLVGRLQGCVPENMYVVKPCGAHDANEGATTRDEAGSGEARSPGQTNASVTSFERETFRFTSYGAYYRRIKKRLEETVDAAAVALYEATYPDPCVQCDICRWWQLCDGKRRDDDHLTLVAGLSNLHASELRRQSRDTLQAFAEAQDALDDRPQYGSRETYERLQGQARVQLEGRRRGENVVELLPYDKDDIAQQGRGLALLPEPNEGDVYFDIEGDHFYEGGGLEYLWGIAHRENGELVYTRFWATDRDEERRAFEQLIDFLVRRRERFADMHVFHFGAYEPATVKRLMGRHGTRQLEVDSLLRGERFVDLHAATKQGLRASVESYSLKNLESFCGYERTIDLREASAALRSIAWALERSDRAGVTDELRATVEGYNREDCESTEALHHWLEARRAELVAQVGEVPRPVLNDGEPGDTVRERHRQVQEVVELLRAGLPDDHSTWDANQRAVGLLAELVPYFIREDRCAWWEYHRLLDLDPDERLEDRKAIEGLELVKDLGPLTAKSTAPVQRFCFPPQEVAFSEGDSLCGLDGADVGSVHKIDTAAHTIDVKRTKKTLDVKPTAVVAFEKVRAEALEASLLEFARSVAEHGVDGDGPYRAARMLLLKRAPRFVELGTTLGAGTAATVLCDEEEESLVAAKRVANLLDHDVLAIQGPPGTGKTYSGGRMIVDLVRAGKRVGVTAVSHKVIRNLVTEALDASRDDNDPGPPIDAVVQKRSKEKAPAPGDLTPGLTLGDKKKIRAAIDDGILVGGTAWLWVAKEMSDVELDYLFVDEAGQLSLAYTLAAARCARNLVLLGDPQQLQQPQRAAHPEGADVAALEHYLDGRPTMPPDKGLFLEATYRLHPSICDFTSDLYYESRLASADGCDGQALLGETRFRESGLWFVPCEHESRQARSPEEVDAIEQIVAELLNSNLEWCDRRGNVAKLEPKDILVIAPYNAQVGSLRERLPNGIGVGTVDKFQGQQAPVVIYSMTSSSAADAPRGLEFLFDPHRLNVATSRAKCVCILVASPRLVEADCKTPEHMRRVNGVAMYRERVVGEGTRS